MLLFICFTNCNKLLTRRLGRFAKVAALVCGRSCDALRVGVAASKLLQRRQICPVASLQSADQSNAFLAAFRFQTMALRGVCWFGMNFLPCLGFPKLRCGSLLVSVAFLFRVSLLISLLPPPGGLPRSLRRRVRLHGIEKLSCFNSRI